MTQPKHDPTRPGTLEEARAQTLTEQEFNKIHDILGRPPNVTELAIFAAMWSEHCSYKNSILRLKTLPRSGDMMLAEAGEENAGLIDIGDGWAVAFKIESHNHPSAVEPFQGAATGVGGILRDIFTMGARPLASLNSLRFGPLSEPRNRFLLDGVVRGIGHYGNCFGVPTVAGEIYFDPSYTGNCLVNAMAVGVVRTDRITRAIASGEGNPVFYVGSRTGRDGIHGATFASEELSEDNEAKRPAVQVGDPFAEKLLLEATLELAQTDALIGIQDMGAAGVICSTSEMSGSGDVGMYIDLDKIPLREEGIIPWEILLSESQERMLLVGEKGKEETIRNIFAKWELEAAEIGYVTDDGLLHIHHGGQKVAEVPAWNLVLGGGAPQYKRESVRPVELDDLASFDPLSLPEPDKPGEALKALLSDPDIASKEWIWRQYDQSVRTNTALEPGRGDAAVIRVEGTTKGISICTDGNGRPVRLDPRRGAALNVAEAARNVACTGAKPVAITNCLNFGNPMKPEVFYFFHEAVAGMGKACREFNTPVTGGNVSFYNETNGGAVFPTPTIGMLGVLEDVSHFTGSAFEQDGDFIYLLGENSGHGLGGSTYLKAIHGTTAGKICDVNYSLEKKLHEFLFTAARSGTVRSAHDVSDGGLAVCIAECCIVGRDGLIGAGIDFPATGSVAAHLFGEAPSRVVISVNPHNCQQVEQLADKLSLPIHRIGSVGGSDFRWKGLIDIPVSELAELYFTAIPRLMDQ